MFQFFFLWSWQLFGSSCLFTSLPFLRLSNVVLCLLLLPWLLCLLFLLSFLLCSLFLSLFLLFLFLHLDCQRGDCCEAFLFANWFSDVMNVYVNQVHPVTSESQFYCTRLYFFRRTIAHKITPKQTNLHFR